MTVMRNNGVTGHRGNPEAAPENTLESFENAIQLGCDILETDVRMTADGRMVLCHDPGTLRTCGVDLVIAETPAEVLRMCNASFLWEKDHGRTFGVTRIPYLEEALEWIRRYPDVRLSLQPKCEYVHEICDIVKAMKMTGQIAFNDGDLAKMKQAKKEIPEALIFYDTDKNSLAEAVKISADLGFYSIVSHYSSLDKGMVEAIAAQGLEPGVWTVNDPAEIRRFLDMGVYRFYSDVPAGVLKEKALLRNA